MQTRYLILCYTIVALLFLMPAHTIAQSEWVKTDKSGELIYKTTKRGDRMIDFSHAGYRGGGVPLPYVPVRLTVSPSPDMDDYSDIIQKAIDAVSAMPLINGFRGAVLLAPGDYPCSKTITISADGVVLRGSGTTTKESTIVMNGEKHTAIVLNNGLRQRVGNRLGEGSPGEKAIKITDTYIPAGSYSFTVADASGLKAGDNVEIRKPVTEKWVKFMNMHNLVRDGKPQTWIKTGTLLIVERTIAAIEGNKVTLTVPLVDSYDANYTDHNTTLVVANDIKRLKQSGVENLRILSPEQAVNHGQALYYALRISGEDCWARDIDALETMESVGVNGRRITLQRVNVIRKALHQGASKPAEFAPNGGQILAENCSVEGDNIWYVAIGGGQTGPIVFLNCHFKGNGRIEGHQRWSTGMLFDNCVLPDGGIDFKNRGSMGSGHGWGTAWSVAWNCEAKNYVNQLPPGTYNWVIGSKGESTPLPRPFDKKGTLPVGVFDSHGKPVMPKSLYIAQLEERLGKSAVTQDSDLKDFPAGFTPVEVGDRIVNKFLVTPHTRFGNPRAEKAPNYITYPDACAWLGALWYAKVTQNKKMTDGLVKRFEPLFSTEKHLLPRMNHVDHNVVGAVPLEIYLQQAGGKAYYDLGMQYADTQWDVPEDAKPEQKAYAEKGYSWQTRIWIDDMFMITTIQSQAYRATNDRKYIDRAANEMVMYLNEIQRPNGLFYHSPDAPFFWARGNGWMAAGMAELLSVLPQDNPNRPTILKAYKKMMETLKGYQGADGMWRQLIDEKEAWNETSGTAMFTYAMIVGVKHGWLDKNEYGAVARKGWLALVGYINADDEITEVCEGTNIKNDKNHYMTRKRIVGDLHAHAPLLWCATELISP